MGAVKWQNLWCSIFGIHILRLLVLIPVPHSEPHESVMTDVFLWSHRDTIFLRSVLDNTTKQCFHVSAQHETFCQQGNKQKHPCLYMPHSKNIITRLIFLLNQVNGKITKMVIQRNQTTYTFKMMSWLWHHCCKLNLFLRTLKDCWRTCLTETKLLFFWSQLERAETLACGTGKVFSLQFTILAL